MAIDSPVATNDDDESVAQAAEAADSADAPRRPLSSDIRVWSGAGVFAVAVVMISVTPLLNMGFIPGRSAVTGIIWAALVLGMIIASGTLFAATAADRMRYAHGRGDRALVYGLLALIGVSTGFLALGSALLTWWLYFGLGFS
jgi:hypothetical protein